LRNLGAKDLKDSLHDFALALNQAHILALPGGFSSGDEPDGSAKFIVNVLRNAKIKTAIEGLLNRGGLILGICNGFQALIKTGLLPYGDIRELDANDATLTHNTLGRHISAIASTRLSSNASPWLSGLKPGSVTKVPLSHGEGRLRVNPKQAEEWARNGQIAFQYCDPDGLASMDPRFNLNGSDYGIEGLISPDGRILGKMGHSERVLNGLYKNIPDMEIFPIIQNGVDYFKKR
jgi:phosphoribosylformylglycinamidine synthase